MSEQQQQPQVKQNKQQQSKQQNKDNEIKEKKPKQVNPHNQLQQQQKKSQQSSAQPINYKLAIFDHLKSINSPSSISTQTNNYAVHEEIIKLNKSYIDGEIYIYEDDERLIELIKSLIVIITEYKTPINKTLSWDLDKYINYQVQYLNNNRMFSIGR